MALLKKQYDVIIVGNGLVGSAMVCALQKAGLRIALLQKQAIVSRLETDWRPISLNYASVKILQTLGISAAFLQQAVNINQVLVTQQGRFGGLTFAAEALKVPMLGAVVSFDHLSLELYQQAMVEAELYTLDQIDSIVEDASSVVVSITSSNERMALSAALLIAADGASSDCRHQLGLSVEQRPCQDVSIAFELQLSASHQQQAWQRFTSQGTLAIVPMQPDNLARLVWTLSDRLAQQVLSWDETQCQVHFNRIYRGYCAEIVAVKRLQSYPLKISVASAQCRGRCILMGNAARTFYPTTAQGFNLAMRDVAALAQLVVAAQQMGQDVGESDLLDTYLAWREPDQKQVMQITASMNTLFGLQLPALSALRGLGLSAIELLPLMKPRLAKRLLGLAGRVPDLALGVSLVKEVA